MIYSSSDESAGQLVSLPIRRYLQEIFALRLPAINFLFVVMPSEVEPTITFLMQQNLDSRSFERQIKSLIKAPGDNIASIDSQIRDLARLRDRERSIIAMLCSTIVPIKKLSVELLVEIFTLATSESNSAASIVSHTSLRILAKNSDHYPTLVDKFLHPRQQDEAHGRVSSSPEIGWIAPLIATLLTGANRGSELTLNISSFAGLPTDTPCAFEKLTKVHIWSQCGPDESAISMFLSAANLQKAVFHTYNLALPWT
ncbi:hypothetical protein FB451DRAFT_1488140 [Mycena latifolia]|nr:hypothetical protein FB451DRAFT_1488140 [Mycena latifolia]